MTLKTGPGGKRYRIFSKPTSSPSQLVNSNQEKIGSGQVPSLLAERAALEGPRSMRAVEGSLGHSH